MSTKTRQELAIEYNVCPRTFRKWLKKYNLEIPSGAIPPILINKIYENFGIPEKINLTDENQVDVKKDYK